MPKDRGGDGQLDHIFRSLAAWRLKAWLELFDAVFRNFSKTYNFTPEVS